MLRRAISITSRTVSGDLSLSCGRIAQILPQANGKYRHTILSRKRSCGGLLWTGSELQEHAEYQETLNVVARLLLQEGLCQEMEIEFPQWIEFVV